MDLKKTEKEALLDHDEAEGNSEEQSGNKQSVTCKQSQQEAVREEGDQLKTEEHQQVPVDEAMMQQGGPLANMEEDFVKIQIGEGDNLLEIDKEESAAPCGRGVEGDDLQQVEEHHFVQVEGQQEEVVVEECVSVEERHLWEPREDRPPQQELVLEHDHIEIEEPQREQPHQPEDVVERAHEGAFKDLQQQIQDNKDIEQQLMSLECEKEGQTTESKWVEEHHQKAGETGREEEGASGGQAEGHSGQGKGQSQGHAPPDQGHQQGHDGGGGGGAGGGGGGGGQEQSTGTDKPTTAGQQQQQGEPAGGGTTTEEKNEQLEPAADALLEDELLGSACLGDVEELRELLGVARLTRDKERFQATLTRLLFTAANRGRVDTLQLLIDFGVDINGGINDINDTALHVAARYDKVAMIEPLVANGIDVMKRSVTDNSALDLAAQNNRTAFVGEMLRVIRARNIALDEKSRYMALTTAIEFGQTETTRLLLAAFPESVNLNLDGDTGTPLHVACDQDNVGIVNILADAGADIEALTSHVMQTPLMRAAECGQVAILKRLLELGADIDRQTEEASSALLLACHFGQTEAVRFLLDAGADPRQKNRWDFTPLFMGADNPDILRLLLEHGLELDELCGDRGEAAIHLAACSGTAVGVRLLLDAGANINNRTSVYETTLWLATWKRHVDIARLVIRLNCDLDEPSDGCQVYKWRYLPFELAIGQQVYPIARMLLKAGCSLYNRVYFSEEDPVPSGDLPGVRLRHEIVHFIKSLNPDFYRHFRQHVRNARRLKDLCRLRLRHLLGCSVTLERNVERLPLPRDLKADLLFEDL